MWGRLATCARLVIALGGGLTTRRPTELVKVSCCRRRNLFRRDSADLRQFPHRLEYERRFVALSAMRDGREIRGVGLDQDAIERGQAGGFTDGFGFREREHSAEAQV